MFFSCHFGVFTFNASILWVGRQELSKDIIPCKILLCWSLGIRPELEWRLEKVYRTTKHKHMYCGDGFNTFRQKTSDTMDQSRMNVHLSACNVPVPQTQFGVIYIYTDRLLLAYLLTAVFACVGAQSRNTTSRKS